MRQSLSFFWRRWLTASFLLLAVFAALPAHATDWQSELATLKQLLSEQIVYTEKLLSLLEAQSGRLADLDKALQTQKRILADSQSTIEHLRSQIGISNESATSLAGDLMKLRTLHEELQTSHNELLKSYQGYKKAAQSEIDDAWRRVRRLRWLAIGEAAIFTVVVILIAVL